MADKIDSDAVVKLGIPLTAAQKFAFDAALPQPEGDRVSFAHVDLGARQRAMAVVERAVAQTELDRKVQANERLRSTAGFVNTIASTMLTVGAASPFAGSYFARSPFADPTAPLYRVAVVCVVCAALLHWLNRVMLSGVRA